MSGKRNKTPADVNKARNEYMESLTLQTQINDMNYQANKDYSVNGTLPAITQMADMRSTTEILLDVEKLKQGIISDLSPIAEAQFASNIVQSVIESNLNVNGGLLRYLAQNAPEIAKQLSFKYKYGIAGDPNDLLVIVQFISQMYNTTKNSLQSVKGYINSNTSQVSGSNILSANDIDKVVNELNDIKKRLALSGIKSRVSTGLLPNPAINDTITRISRIKDYLPNNKELGIMIENVNNFTMDTIEGGDLHSVFLILEQLPKLNTIQTLLDILNKSILNKDMSLFDRTLLKIKNEFLLAFSDDVLNTLERFRNDVLQPIRDRYRDEINNQNQMMRANDNQEREQERRANNAQRVLVVNPYDDEAYVRFGAHASEGGLPVNTGSSSSSSSSGSYPGSSGSSGSSGSYPGSSSGSSSSGSNPPMGSSSSSLKPPISPPVGALSGMFDNPLFKRRREAQQYEEITGGIGSAKTDQDVKDLVAVVTGIIKSLTQEEVDQLADIIRSKKINVKNTPGSIIGVMTALIQDNKYTYGDFGGEIYGLGIPKKRRGRPRGSGIVQKPVLIKVPNYVGFGINEVSKKNLDKGILTIRRNTRTNIIDMPSRRVSPKFKNIVNSIIGGGVPNYNDMTDLDQEEKNYLYKLIQKSNLKDRLSVPAPCKDLEEKDIHSFEVMKGEILAGNDNRDMIKKFKLLTVKLSKMGLLPKNESSDLLTLLVELGY